MAVSPLTLACLIAATLFVAALPIVLYRRLRTPLALDWREAVAGIAVFALFAMVIERALNGYLLSSNPTTAAWLSNPLAFVVCGALAIGICQEVGRFIAMRWMFKRAARKSSTPASGQRDSAALGYGLGHGGAEAWLTGVLVQLQWIAFAVLENRGQLGDALSNIPFEMQMRIHLIVVSLTPVQAGVFVLERLASLVFQIALSVLMWRGVRAGSWTILPLAIAAHALIEVPAALSQAHVLSLAVVDSIYVLAALPLAVALVKLFRSAPRAA
ncbi:MAG TPA: YhfC family intramembrane metalloprotease [Paraburkholderia sp.]|jgi:uncharacterized membrane protein YhfC